MPESDFDETRAVARLPHLDIEIVHRRPREGDGEQILISLQATPSFDAFAQFLDAMNPFRLWANLAQMTWAQWASAFQMPLLRDPVRTPSAQGKLPARRVDGGSGN